MSGIQSPLILIIVVGLVIIIAVALVRNREDSEWGFKDVVKNPAYWDSSSQAQQEADEATAAAKTWSADEVASATRHFIFEVSSSREAWVEARILRELDERTHPAIFEKLESRYYASTEVVEVLATQFVIANPNSFR
jgi:hypothetical protein